MAHKARAGRRTIGEKEKKKKKSTFLELRIRVTENSDSFDYNLDFRHFPNSNQSASPDFIQKKVKTLIFVRKLHTTKLSFNVKTCFDFSQKNLDFRGIVRIPTSSETAHN